MHLISCRHGLCSRYEHPMRESLLLLKVVPNDVATVAKFCTQLHAGHVLQSSSFRSVRHLRGQYWQNVSGLTVRLPVVQLHTRCGNDSTRTLGLGYVCEPCQFLGHDLWHTYVLIKSSGLCLWSADFYLCMKVMGVPAVLSRLMCVCVDHQWLQ
jgi:hypothetical protein